ncbi:MAG: YhbY family RNA-binding protein, partial [Methanomicrobiaceae archaeon]|nr:YhbY family RNA-binding protein [Methanomicrobiaceae archaeon]
SEDLHRIRPSVWIGKYGCTPEIIEEIRSQLAVRKIIKVRWLRNADVDPEELARLSKSRILQRRGRTVILALPVREK